MVMRRPAVVALALLSACIPSPSRAPDASAAREGAGGLAVLTIAGARVPPADATGQPLLQVPAPYTRLISPVSAAGTGTEYYVADAGATRVYRYDPALDMMSVVGNIPVRADTRLFTGPDDTLFVIEPPAHRVARYTRDGRLVAAYADAQHLVHPVGAAWDEAGGRLLVADGVYRHLVAFHPAGRAAYVLPIGFDERHVLRSVGAIAAGRSGVHIADPACRCVMVVGRDGRIAGSYGHGELVHPGAVALDDRERAYVADVGAQRVRVYEGVREVAVLEAAQLGLAQVSDLTIAGGRLIVADAAAARVAVLRIADWRRERP